MITKEEVLVIHNYIVTSSGHPHGVRDIGMFESAIARPFQTFGETDLYINIFEKAAAISESLITNHPFVKGNKRTAFKVMSIILEKGNYQLNISDDESFRIRTKIAQGVPFNENYYMAKK
jgi:death-on-curing protein